MMDADLKSLEERVSKLVALSRHLSDDNAQLRQELLQLQQETQALKLNMAQAGVQLERLLSALPEGGQ